MTDVKKATGWDEPEIQQIRRFLITLFLKLFVGGKTPREVERRFRKLCGDGRDYNGTISGYFDDGGNLPPLSELLKREKGAAGFAYCGWHPVCSLVAGKAPPEKSQLKYFWDNADLLYESRKALVQSRAAANDEQREFLNLISALDRLATALLEFRLAQRPWNDDMRAKASASVRNAWLDVQPMCAPALKEPLQKLMNEGFFLARVATKDSVYTSRTACEIFKVNNGLTQEGQIGYLEVVGKENSSRTLRTLLFSSGSMRFDGVKWSGHVSRGFIYYGWGLVSVQVALVMLCIASLCLNGGNGLWELAEAVCGVLVILSSATICYYLFIWPQKRLRAIIGSARA